MGKTERANIIDQAITSGKAISDSTFQSLTADYPYFLPAIVLRMRAKGLNADQHRQLLSAAATTIGNRTDLFYLVDDDGEDLRHLDQEPDTKTKSTMDTITHFLDTFGSNDAAETKALEQKIFNPTPDYSQVLEREEKESLPDDSNDDQLSEQDKLINKFIKGSKEHKRRFPAATDGADKQPAEEKPKTPKAQRPAAPATDDSTLLSESLAKINIRQHKYEKALEIIQSLNLKYPEKSIYFADQIRFLKKLIANEKYKQNKQ